MAVPSIASKTVLSQDNGRKSQIFLARPLFYATIEGGPVGVSPTAIQDFGKVGQWNVFHPVILTF